jgi:SAM-dependent methyltransferase
MHACPVCHSEDQRPLLSRRGVPVHQNLLLASRAEARATPLGDLDVRVCLSCGFGQNVAFREELLSYGHGYENTQTFSPTFERHVEQRISEMVAEGVRGKRVLEIGCGKGEFLTALCRAGGNDGVGFDPSYVGPDATLDGRVRFVRQLFGSTGLPMAADVVVCRHVIEHVADPVGFLSSIRRVLPDTSDAVTYFETPSLEWILGGGVVWDFFYEHCSYFSGDGLLNALRASGFGPVEQRPVFEGQYQWLKARPAAEALVLRQASPDLAVLLESYRAREVSLLTRWAETVDALSSAGSLAVWGAGAKGVTFVNLLDPTAARVRCLVDINPAKQGHFAPGTGHPVVAPVALGSLGITDAIMMNPNYKEETREIVAGLGLKIALHPAG